VTVVTNDGPARTHEGPAGARGRHHQLVPHGGRAGRHRCSERPTPPDGLALPLLDATDPDSRLTEDEVPEILGELADILRESVERLDAVFAATDQRTEKEDA
jgi:hypothetical protein